MRLRRTGYSKRARRGRCATRDVPRSALFLRDDPRCGPVLTVAASRAVWQANTPPYEIAWNYEKFLVDEDGIPVGRWRSHEDPMLAEPMIRSLLGLEEPKTSTF